MNASTKQMESHPLLSQKKLDQRVKLEKLSHAPSTQEYNVMNSNNSNNDLF